MLSNKVTWSLWASRKKLLEFLKPQSWWFPSRSTLHVPLPQERSGGCQEHPSSGTGQELPPPGQLFKFPLRANCPGLPGAPDAHADVAGSTLSRVDTTNSLGAEGAQGSPAAPACGSKNQSKEGNQERGLSPALKHCDILWWLCLSLQNFLIFYKSSSL